MVVRCTFLPLADKPKAMAAATVVLPTPPLPIVKITFLPVAANSSTTACKRGIDCAFTLSLLTTAWSCVRKARIFSIPVIL